MTPESLIQFKNLKNRTGEDLVGMILYDLSRKSDEENAKLETISTQLARGEEEEGLREMEERMDRRAAQEVLAGIKEAIEGKKIDLSEILAGLAMVAMEIREGSDEAKELLQSIETKEHTDITAALSSIYEKMCEEKMEKPEDYSSIIESQKEGFSEVVRTLTELALASKEKRETESVKVEGEVEIAKPSWWKEYVLDWKPLEKLLEPIKSVLEKILEKETQELPIKDGRVLVSLDQRFGGGLGNPFSFDGEAVKMQTDSVGRYRISDIDDVGSTQYYGYTDESGRWYIMRFDTTAKQMRYTKGLPEYPTNWSSRVSLTYQYFDQVFN